MKIYIEVASWFKRYTAGKTELELEIAGGATACEAAAAAGIPVEEIGFIASGNGKIDPGYLLVDGDRLKVYPHIIGG